MEIKHIQLNNFKVTNEHEFQKLGKEITTYCGKPAYFIFTKYHHGKIKDAFAILQKSGKTDLNYLIGIIKKLK